MRTSQSFDHLYVNVVRKSEGLRVYNQRFQESDCIRLDWRLVLVHQATPRLPKINLGSFMRLLILSSVLWISALIRKASALIRPDGDPLG